MSGVQQGVVHWLVDSPADENAKSVCGISLLRNRIYPLLWTNDSPRLLTCKRCLAVNEADDCGE